MAIFQLSVIILVFSIIVYKVPSLFEPKLLPIVEGYFQPEFMEVAQLLKKNMENGKEQGASFAVYHNGEVVIDMWAGYADRDSMRRWRNETTTLAFGCTKGVMAILTALMVERGVLNYSRPISEYWPEFGVNGKKDITLEMLINHKAGLPYVNETISLRDLVTDRKHIDESIYLQTPIWKPGTKHGIHEWTFGLILDQLVQKADPKHRPVSQIFEEEIAAPLGLEFDLHLKKRDVHKTARIYKPSIYQAVLQAISSPSYLKLYKEYFTSLDSLVNKVWGTVKENIVPMTVFNDPELREITLTSYSGTGTARGLAKLFSVLANDGMFEGNLILKTETIDRMMGPPGTGDTCAVTGLPKVYSLGMQVFTNPQGERTLGSAGYGGQMVIADPTNRLSIAYLTSYLSVYSNGDDPKFTAIQAAVYNGLQRYIDRKERMAKS